MAQIRDYNEIVRRLEALPQGKWQLERVGNVWGYPFLCLRRTVATDTPVIFLSSGMHGEEPAGVEGVLRWLEDDEWEKWRTNWLVLPCINPYGWERNQRTNAQRRDINRQFRNSSDCPEAELVKEVLNGRKFLFSMEFHEDVEARGYYLYELKSDGPFIGEQVVSAVSKVVPINRAAVIDGNRTTGRGLIRREPGRNTLLRRRRWPMAFHVFVNCTSHVLGSETPVHVGLDKRVKAHHRALAAALRAVM